MAIRGDYTDPEYEWWSADEAANFANVSRRTVEGWSYHGHVRSRKVTRQRLWRRDIEALVAGEEPKG
jgi:predicted site-specific integrase-resolvase